MWFIGVYTFCRVPIVRLAIRCHQWQYTRTESVFNGCEKFTSCGSFEEHVKRTTSVVTILAVVNLRVTDERRREQCPFLPSPRLVQFQQITSAQVLSACASPRRRRLLRLIS